MASITIRQLDDELKQRLRLRAARNGRSMEDEVRTILRRRPRESDAASPASRAPRRRGAAARRRGPPKPRGHETRPARSSAAASRPTSRSISFAGCKERGAARALHSDRAAQKFITPLAAGALCGRARLHRPVRSRERIRRRPHPAGARVPISSWSRPRPPTSWPRWRAATPTISPPRCCSRPTGRSWSRRP